MAKRSTFKLQLSPAKMRKQVRFAASRALNDSAFAARAALVRETRDRFTLRSTYTERGYRVGRATRRRLEARVGTIRDYLVDQVRGGRRRDKAIPGRHVRKTPAQRVTRRRWPRPLLNKPRHFLADARGRDRRRLVGGLARHAGRRERIVFRVMGGRRRRRQRLRLLYVIPRRQRVRRRLPFDRTVQRAHRGAYRDAFARRLQDALATAR